MTDKTEEQIVREKAQVAAMKNAQATMSAVLSRCAALESALTTARDNLLRCKEQISPHAYAYKIDGQRQETTHQRIDAMVADATRAIG